MADGASRSPGCLGGHRRAVSAGYISWNSNRESSVRMDDLLEDSSAAPVRPSVDYQSRPLRASIDEAGVQAVAPLSFEMSLEPSTPPSEDSQPHGFAPRFLPGKTRGTLLLLSGWLVAAAAIAFLAVVLITTQLTQQDVTITGVADPTEAVGSGNPDVQPSANSGTVLPDSWVPAAAPGNIHQPESNVGTVPTGTATEGSPAAAPDSPSTCRVARSRAVFGSGPTICYEGLATEDDAGDGACAICTDSNSPDACLACPRGSVLEVSDSTQCSGRCVPLADPQLVVVPATCEAVPMVDLSLCDDLGDTPLCYDRDWNCKYRASWDMELCTGPMAPSCQATCGGCSPEAGDTYLKDLLLHWKQGLSLDEGSMLDWGWIPGIPVDQWPGVLLDDLMDGAFLNQLHLQSAGFSGPLDSFWGLLYRPGFRMDWDLSHNHITGSLPSEWANVMGHLGVLDLSRNSLTGTLPLAWTAGVTSPSLINGGIQTWMELHLGSNMLTGTLPPEWFSSGPLKDVVDLNLEGNLLEGPLPPQWSVLGEEMDDLSIGSNKLTGALPVEYSAFTDIRYLRAGDNSLNGTLPAEYSVMERLTILDLQGNEFQGPLPAHWSAMQSWETVWNLGGNNLTGSLPEEWSTLRLTRLELHSNLLTGTVPEWLSSLTLLLELDLSGNNFTGTVPASLSSCSGLRILRLGNNSLTGTVPEVWSSLTHLQVLDLAGNAGLSGPVPVPEGVHVSVSSTSLEWTGDVYDLFDFHGELWELGGQYGDGSTEPTCLFCRHLPAWEDQCTCVHDCCSNLNEDSRHCSDYRELMLTTEDCKDPCGYCWTLAALPERIACFHSCCVGNDDDDIYPMFSTACVRAEEMYEYEDYGL